MEVDILKIIITESVNLFFFDQFIATNDYFIEAYFLGLMREYVRKFLLKPDLNIEICNRTF